MILPWDSRTGIPGQGFQSVALPAEELICYTGAGGGCGTGGTPYIALLKTTFYFITGHRDMLKPSSGSLQTKGVTQMQTDLKRKSDKDYSTT